MTRRMTVIVLALVGLMVLAVTISPPDRGVQEGSEATPAPTAAPAPSDPDAFDVDETLSAQADAPERTVEAEVGDRVAITVEAAGPDSVQLGDLATRNVEAGIPARFELLADTPGSYPLVLVNAEQPIGTLLIR